MTDRSRTIYTI